MTHDKLVFNVTIAAIYGSTFLGRTSTYLILIILAVSRESKLQSMDRQSSGLPLGLVPLLTILLDQQVITPALHSVTLL